MRAKHAELSALAESTHEDVRRATMRNDELAAALTQSELEAAQRAAAWEAERGRVREERELTLNRLRAAESAVG